MLYIGDFKKRYFLIHVKGFGELEIESPTLRDLKSLTEIFQNPVDENVGKLMEVTSHMVSKNKQQKEITRKYIEENLDYDDIKLFLTEYMKWVYEVSESPN